MGLGAVGAIIGGVFSLIGAGIQASAERDAAAQEKEANQIQQAAQENQSETERRETIRQERLKRSRIQQSSINTGVSGSSGESGAIGSLGTNLSNLSSGAIGQGVANEGINLKRQEATDTRSAGAAAGAMFSSIGSLFG